MTTVPKKIQSNKRKVEPLQKFTRQKSHPKNKYEERGKNYSVPISPLLISQSACFILFFSNGPSNKQQKKE